MCKAIFNKGKIKTDLTRQRKHVIQMNQSEIKYLVNKLNEINYFRFTRHSNNKMEELDIIASDLSPLLHNFEPKHIIEFNNGRGDESRVLVRSDDEIVSEEGIKINLCFVVDIHTHTIVTVYVNRSNDNHSTLNLNYYTKHLKVI